LLAFDRLSTRPIILKKEQGQVNTNGQKKGGNYTKAAYSLINILEKPGF
jgi:hypothetical protein